MQQKLIKYESIKLLRMSILLVSSAKSQQSLFVLKHVKAWLTFWSRPPREDKAVFLQRPCILILKVAKTFEKLSFEALN